MATIGVVTIVWNINSHHQGTTRWVFALDTFPTPTETQDARDFVRDAFNARKSWLASSVALHRVETQEVEFVNDPEHGHRFHPLTVAVSDTYDVNGTGNIGSSAQVAYRVTLPTARAGRKYRGRQFLPGIPEDKVDASGLVDATAVGNAAQFSADVGSGVETQWVAETAVWVTPSFLDATLEPITVPVGRAQAGTQRRRLKATSIT